MCRALWSIRASDELFDSIVLSEADWNEVKMLDVSSVLENYPKMKEEKSGLNVSAILCEGAWNLTEQWTQSISVIFINRLEIEVVFA